MEGNNIHLLSKYKVIRFGIPLLLIGYFIWEVYWFLQVGYYFIRWHTHLMIYIYTWIIGVFIIKKTFNQKSRRLTNFFSSIIIFLGALELLLHVVGINKTSSEIKYGVYESFYKVQQYNHANNIDTAIYFHTWNNKTSTHLLKTEEFEYSRPTNSIGFADVEWRYANEGTKEIRILALGDSFTEGDGAPFDSSYVSLLSKKMINDSIPFYIMNAGVCGSDPAFNFINLRDRLIRFKPDFAIQSISTSDVIHDIAIRGGMERFDNNGNLNQKKAPWWEPIFAISYISRFILNYNQKGNDLITYSESELRDAVEGIFIEYITFTQANNLKLIVVYRPDIHEIILKKYMYDFSQLRKQLSGHRHVYQFDLLPGYIKHFENKNNNVNEYFWPKDRHHNSKGYALMADEIYSFMKQLPLDSIYKAKEDTTRAPQN